MFSFSYIVMRIILVRFMTHVNRVWAVDDMNRIRVCGSMENVHGEEIHLLMIEVVHHELIE